MAPANPKTPGRKPRKVFINVRIRASTRDRLHRIVAAAGCSSQGEAIDRLVESVRIPAGRRPR